MNRVPICFSGVEYLPEFLEDLCVDFLVEFVGGPDEAALGYAYGECCFFCECEVAPELCPGVGGPVCFFCFCVFFRFSGGFVELGPCVASHFGCDGYVDCGSVVVCGGVWNVVVDGYGGVGRCVVDRREEVVARREERAVSCRRPCPAVLSFSWLPGVESVVDESGLAEVVLVVVFGEASDDDG